MNKQDGGPAFPLMGTAPEDGTPIEFHGMSLRDYFIAHAPAEPQFWFWPDMPISRPEPIYEGHDCTNQKSISAWDAEHDKQRYVQWPAAWADEMLKAREE